MICPSEHGMPPFVHPFYQPSSATNAFVMAYMRASLKSAGSNPDFMSDAFQLANSQLKLPGGMQLPTSDNSGGPRKRKKWSRAVFRWVDLLWVAGIKPASCNTVLFYSLSQRRGLEKSFQLTKYVAKPERKSLAEALGLTDAQVSIKTRLACAKMYIRVIFAISINTHKCVISRNLLRINLKKTKKALKYTKKIFKARFFLRTW